MQPAPIHLGLMSYVAMKVDPRLALDAPLPPKEFERALQLRMPDLNREMLRRGRRSERRSIFHAEWYICIRMRYSVCIL